MFKDENPTALALPQSSRNEDAVFMGWQKTGSGEVFASGLDISSDDHGNSTPARLTLRADGKRV
jgi:hypothetical protein